MKIKLTLLIAVIAILTSCQKSDVTVQNIYTEKVVVFNAKRFLLNQDKGVLAATKGMTALARVASSFEWPIYEHTIPTKFTAYFIATTGADRGTIIKEIVDITEGDHQITIQARPYMVVVTNYNIKSKLTTENNRRWLPEKSTELYLYGESSIDYSQVNSGSVTVTNDYAAVLVLKNEIVQSTPSITGTSFIETPNYYLLYTRDQNGATTFTRDIQLKAKSRDGSVIDYPINGAQLKANIENRFMLNLYSDKDGNFNVTVDKNILKEAINTEIIVNR